MENAYSNNLLEFISNEERYNRNTGELYYIHKRKYLNLTFIFLLDCNSRLKKMTVRGSIHKIFNGGSHNANKFTFEKFNETIQKFSRKFCIDLSRCILLPFEYGQNLKLDDFSKFNAEEIVMNAICEQRKMFQQNVSGCDSSVVSGSYGSETRTKIYVKSIESPNWCKNTLRLEVQQKKLRDFHKRNIKYVSDLLEFKNQKIIVEKYIGYINHLVLFDYTMRLPKQSKFNSKILNLKNPNYWRKQIKDCGNGTVHNTKYNEEIKSLNNLSRKYGANLLEKLIQQIERQCNISLGYCDVNEFEIQKTPKYAQVQKTKNAQLYNTCMVCETVIQTNFLNAVISSCTNLIR